MSLAAQTSRSRQTDRSPLEEAREPEGVEPLAPRVGPRIRRAGERSSDAYTWAYESLFMPAWERGIRRRDTLDHLSFLEIAQWMHPVAIEQLQLQELRALLRHAGRHVPYYRELFAKERFDPRGITSVADLAELPVLTRDIVRERYADLVDPASRGLSLKKGTSGSTGEPLKFEYSRESEAWRQATRIRGYRWAGYEPGAPTFYYWALVSRPPSGPKGWKLRLDRALKREVFVDSMVQNEAANLRAVELLRRHKPQVIVAYTQSTALFARFILDRGLRDWDDIPVICGAEAVLPGDRAAIAKAFGPGVFETYGSRETMLMAAECEAHDGMHLSEENLVVEVAPDPEQRESGVTEGSNAPGRSGPVIVTDLHNYAMPFIRYANGDLGTLRARQVCSCGRGLRKLARVDGRRADTMRAKDGTPIPGVVFHVLFSDARKEVVCQFQAVQRRAGDVILRVVPGQDWEQAAFDVYVERFRAYLQGLPLRVEICESIPPAANGKHRTVIVEKTR
jgi:phenylacetate-CoA ligase